MICARSPARDGHFPVVRFHLRPIIRRDSMMSDDGTTTSFMAFVEFVANHTPQELVECAEAHSEPITIRRLKAGYAPSFRKVADYRGAVITALKDAARATMRGEGGW